MPESSKAPGKHNRQYWDDMLDSYLLGRLSEQEKQIFEEQCMNDKSLFEELVFREKLACVVREEAEATGASPAKQEQEQAGSIFTTITSHIQQLNWKWAYAPAAIAILAALIFLFKASVEPVGESFKPNVALESLVRQVVTRSQPAISDVSPRNGVTVAGDLRFEWQTSYAGVVYWKILDNQENIRMSGSTQDSQFVLEQIEKTLQPGLYYWKLESDTDLLHVGKFLISSGDH